MLESVLAEKAQSDETAAVEELACLAGERQVEWKLASLELKQLKSLDPKQLANINQKIEKTKTELLHPEKPHQIHTNQSGVQSS